MATQKSSAPDEGFTIERHGELTVITATEAVERIDFGLEEQVAELILKPLRRQDNPSIVFDLTQRRELRFDVPGPHDPVLEAGFVPGRHDGAVRSQRSNARIAQGHGARHGLADL